MITIRNTSLECISYLTEQNELIVVWFTKGNRPFIITDCNSWFTENFKNDNFYPNLNFFYFNTEYQKIKMFRFLTDVYTYHVSGLKFLIRVW